MAEEAKHSNAPSLPTQTSRSDRWRTKHSMELRCGCELIVEPADDGAIWWLIDDFAAIDAGGTAPDVGTAQARAERAHAERSPCAPGSKEIR